MNNIIDRFNNCKNIYLVAQTIKEYIQADLCHFMKVRYGVLTTAINDLCVDVQLYILYKGTDKFGHSIITHDPSRKDATFCAIHITTTRGKWAYEKNLGWEFLMKLLNGQNYTLYIDILEEIYWKYESYYRIAYADELYQRYAAVADGLLHIVSPQTGQELKSKFCSCCGARLVEGATGCDYCGAVFAIN